MQTQNRLFFLLLNDWTWWVWAVSAAGLFVSLLAWPAALLVVIGITVLQTAVIVAREKSLTVFAVQLRVVFLALLLVCLIPQMRWLTWLPTVGLSALVIFGYCLLARVLSLLPGNRSEPISVSLLRRTFFSRPDLGRVAKEEAGVSCPGGLCTIDAQVPREQAG